LSRIRSLFVIARNSSFTYKGQSIDVKQVGRELSVRYVLEGSVRKAGGRVRITGQLIDAIAGTHLWADHFDGSMEEVFELQDKVAASVAGVIEPALQAAETARSASRPTDDLTAYDLYLRAYAMVLSSTRQAPEALRLLEQAIARDPRYGPALAVAALCCFRLLYDDRSEDSSRRKRRTYHLPDYGDYERGDGENKPPSDRAPLQSFRLSINPRKNLRNQQNSTKREIDNEDQIPGRPRPFHGRPDHCAERSNKVHQNVAKNTDGINST